MVDEADEAEEIVRLEIPARPAFVGVARTVVAAIAGTVEGIDDDRLEDLRIAVSEACTNAVEAHQAEGVDDRVVLRCTVAPHALAVRIEDSGSGFDVAELPESPGPEDPERLRNERGWGISLIRALVDDVAFSRTGAGTAVTLTLRRAHVGV